MMTTNASSAIGKQLTAIIARTAVWKFMLFINARRAIWKSMMMINACETFLVHYLKPIIMYEGVRDKPVMKSNA